MSIYKSSKWMNSPQQDRLLEVFLKNSPIIIDWNFRNNQKIENNRLIFGPWAGTEQCITTIIHEMAHLVEIEDARILSDGWGFRLPEVYVPGRYARRVSTSKSIQATLRECRVMALQWHVQNYLGIEVMPRDLLSSLVFMPDWLNIPRNSHENYDIARLEFAENKMMGYAKEKYTLDFFMTEWSRKNQLLQQVLGILV